MNAELKELYSRTVDLRAYVPERADFFGVWVTAIVGTQGEAGGDAFEILICSPEWLKKECRMHHVILGRHKLITDHFDAENIYHCVKNLVESIEGESWEEISKKMARIGAWEFEDYNATAR
ncbi:immunity 8 family protein [Inquilinus limosus]|uniref:immunity 8 family protein n=1 Tax=Inquilinus limosus TaxID=171674 RepID=UPI00138AC0FE|nr:immunity 8 family protein [Inquilinus limosus]